MIFILKSAALLAAATLALPEEDKAEVVVQQKITVTASRVEQTLDESLASVSVLSRQDIEMSLALDLLDLLRQQAGVDVSSSGGPGSQTSVFLRGSNSNHTLVLIDGVRAASLHTGAFAWENLPLAMVDHIEIVRGPRAGYYGSDAIGGVIHIHTRRPEAATMRVSAGSFGTGQLEAGGALRLGSGRLAVSMNYRDSDGFSAQNPSGFSYHPDDDGFREYGALVALQQEFAGQRADVRLRIQQARVDFDQGRSDTDSGGLALRVAGPLAADWQHALNLGWLDERRETPAFFSLFDSERLDLDWQLSYSGRPGQVLTLGVAYVDEQGFSRDTFGNSLIYSGSRNNAALFGGWQLARDRQDLEVSLRLDDNSEFGSQVTGQLAWARPVGRHAGMFASFGTAFRAPTLSEQLSPGFGGLFAGNRSLDPERSRSLELGLRVQSNPQRLSLSLYHTRIEDLIDFSGVDFQALNIAEARIEGFEAAYQWRSLRWRADASLTLQRTEDKGSGRDLLRRPNEKLALTADRLFAGGARLGVEALYSGARDDFVGRLGSYVLLGVRSSYPLGQRWRVEARLSNLLDEDYQLAEGFNTAGRAAFLSLRYAAN